MAAAGGGRRHALRCHRSEFGLPQEQGGVRQGREGHGGRRPDRSRPARSIPSEASRSRELSRAVPLPTRAMLAAAPSRPGLFAASLLAVAADRLGSA